MERTQLIEEIRNMVSEYGTSYTGYKTLNLANQSLADDNKVVDSIDMDSVSGRLCIEMEWFDDETGENKRYVAYPVDMLNDKDLNELHDLVSFAVIDHIF